MKDHKYNEPKGIRLIYKRGSPKYFKINDGDLKATKTVDDMKDNMIDKHYDYAIFMEIYKTNLREMPTKFPKSLKTLQILCNCHNITIYDEEKKNKSGNHMIDDEKSISIEETRVMRLKSYQFHY